MIIEAKSTRQPTEPAQGRQRFEFNTPERLSKLPMYIALIAIGIATYIKNAFDSHTVAMTQPDAPSAPEQHRQDPVNWCVSSDERLTLAALLPEIDDIETGSIDGAGPRQQLGQGLPWQTDFLLPESPALVFAKALEPYALQIGAIFPVAFGVSASNDNGGPLATKPDDDDHNGPDTDPKEDDDGDDDTQANRAPVVYGPVRLNDVFAGQVFLIGLSSLLLGAHDPDGDALTITHLSASGVAVVRSMDGWTVTTQHGMLGPVTFTYLISDGQASVAQTASFEIVRNRDVLTPNDDLHASTPYDDDIDALAGDDTIDALAGNDLVNGGEGDDHIQGGDGDDHLFGDAGNDFISGGKGDDLISGGDGNDRLFGDDGDDVIQGGAGDDHLHGGSGDDILRGGSGNDAMAGETGNDALSGGDGCDTLAGGEGDDFLSGNDGDDRILGDAGNDHIDGGEDDDILDMSAACDDLYVDMTEGTVCGEEIGNDQFANVEQVITGSGDDIIIFGATATVTSGGGGRDTFVFQVSGDDPSLSDDVVHDILDFVVGDRIRVLDYDISREAERAERDLFRSVYDDDDDWLKSDLPIIVSHVRYDDVDQTIIKADIDHDNHYEITINIYGLHLPVSGDHNLA